MTPKQEQFARLYVETGNASEAYRQAYNADNMKPETVTNEAYKLLQDPDISAMVDDLKRPLQKSLSPNSQNPNTGFRLFPPLIAPDFTQIPP